jgi:hypothetical protein
VTVSDDQVAALRAHLLHEFDKAGRLNRQIAEATDMEGYGEFVWAAFVLAARRRFAPEWTVPQIVKYVAAARARWGKDADDIDPRTAEIMMRRALDDHVPTDLDEMVRGRAQVFLLTELIANDQELDEAGLDELLAQARALADKWAVSASRRG